MCRRVRADRTRPQSRQEFVRPMLNSRQGVQDMEIYEAGLSGLPGRTDVLKLSSNENPYGTSPRAAEAYSASADALSRYPSSDHADLRSAIEGAHGLAKERIVCGAGSDEILALLCKAFAGPGTEVIHTAHGFLMYRILAKSSGAVPVEVPEIRRKADAGTILKAATDRTRLVFLANPSNPTGAMLDSGELARLASGLPGQAILVLDGAYAEYVDGFDGGAELVRRSRNVVMTRTFSKIYGLASLRVGYGYGPPGIVDALNRLRSPFNVAGPAAAAAAAAVRDQDFVRRCRARNAEWRAWLADRLARCGVPSDPSHANFVLAGFSGPEEAASCDAHLKENGIIVRRMEQYKLPNCLRITVGDEAACRAVADAIARFKRRGA